MNKIQLGDEVKHTITGVKGIVVSKTSYLSGCDRVTVQQKVNKDGTLPDGLSFDEPEVEVIKPKKKKENNRRVGGWKPTLKARQTNSRPYQF